MAQEIPLDFLNSIRGKIIAMTDKTEILKKLDNSKLVDVVKNHRQYGYDESVMAAALSELELRGVDTQSLKRVAEVRKREYAKMPMLMTRYLITSTVALVCYFVSVAFSVFSFVLVLYLHFPGKQILLVLVPSLILFLVCRLWSLILYGKLFDLAGRQDLRDRAWRDWRISVLFYVAAYFYFWRDLRRLMRSRSN